MPLEEYRRKRDFDITPEPSGDQVPERPGLAYVIQKHAASRLHWDFRLELDGVMLSWAVPKGPSLDTAEKRLAVHVEDHPVAYGAFEGVIPSGEYGGGTVMLWDRGTWEPDHGDPKEHLAQGHLKFFLYGERLRGKWMLVRTKGYGRSSAESWLLFKERDQEARPKSEFDATTEWTTSVATGRTMDQIAQDVEAVWHSDLSAEDNVAAAKLRATDLSSPAPLSETQGAMQAPLPPHVEVQLATLSKQVPEGDAWLHEVKFDGYRIVALLDDRNVRLVSRNGKDWTERFPDIATAVAALPAGQAVLDGEVVVLRPDGSTDFQALQNHARRESSSPLNYMAFDLLYLDGYDLRGVALEQRKSLLSRLVPHHDDRVRYTDHIEGHGDTFFNKACDFSLEGVVSKRKDSRYRAGRGRDWLKTKCLQRQEFVVVGYTDPEGSRSSFGALVLGVYRDGALVHAGRVGTGFTEESLRGIHERLVALVRDDPPVSDLPASDLGSSIHWVEPQLVAEVSFAEWTAEGVLRHPSFLGLREDKRAEEVVPEQPTDLPLPPDDPPAKQGPPTVAGVTLSNPDRALWPDVGVSKLQLARYYETVADLVLPYVAHRPLSLVRCPDGYTGECFYQKHIANFPAVVGTVDIYEPGEDKVSPYACVSDLAGLVGLVQMGVLEIHPWGSRCDHPEKPDLLVFDLDPDLDLPWTNVAATALLLRSELDRLGLTSWLKTTGGKGLHVVAPLVRRHTWDEVKEFSRAFVESIVAIEPRLFTASMSKAHRTGRIFIDYLRNTRGSTAVAPYSTRARVGAPVAVPLLWEEIEGSASRPWFTVTTLPDRLTNLAQDPWAGYESARQSITKRARAKLGIDG